MADNVSFVKVVSQGGLNSTENHLLLEDVIPGGAHKLVNYEIGLYGGYRRINGYQPLNSDFETVDDTNAEGKILGLAIFKNILDQEVIIAARKQTSGNTYNFYYLDNTLGWTPYTLGFTLAASNGTEEVVKIRHTMFTVGNVSYIIFVDGINTPTIFDGTTWYNLTAGVAAGTSVDPGGDQLLSKPSLVCVFQNHIFFGGDSDYPGVICHTAPNNVFDCNVASGAGQVLAQFKVYQIKPFRESLFVLGRENIKKINVSNTTFVINDVASNIGTIAPDSVIEMNGDILFLAQDGVRTISGTDKIGDINLGSISRPIQKLINRLQDEHTMSYLNSTVIKKKSQFRLFASEATTSSYGEGIIGGIRDINGQAGWEFGELQGIRTSVVTSGYIGDEEYTLHGDYNGGVYRQEVGNSFNGDSIFSIYATPFLSMGDPTTRKLSRNVHTFIRPEGTATINLGVSYNWESMNVHNPNTYPSTTTLLVTTYDDPSVIYDDPDLIYDDVDFYPVLSNSISGSFQSVRLTYSSYGTYDPYTIQGFIFEFTPEGKR